MVKYGPRQDQLLGRILLEGMKSLTEEEKIEFYLGCYKPKKNLDLQLLARRMAEKFGSLADMVLLSPAELMQVEGMYRALAERFSNLGKTIRTFARYEKVYQKIYIRSVVELFQYILPLYRISSYPGTWQLCLNEDYELIYQREITPSRAWGEEDAVQNSLSDAHFFSAKYVIIVQMCGREPANPKEYDKQHAKIHGQRLQEIGCRLLDVALVDEGRLTSMYELDMIALFSGRAENKQSYLNERVNQ